MKKLITSIALAACAFTTQACTLNSWFYNEAPYSKSVIRLSLNISGCTSMQRIDLKVFENGEFVGAETVYGNTTQIAVDLKRPPKAKKLTLEASIGAPVKPL